MNALRRILHSLILTINFGIVLLMILCGYAFKIKPDYSIFASFLGYAFPVLALANLFFIFYWILRMKGWILISVIGFALTFNSYRAWFPINWHSEKNTENTIKLLSYNVMYFQFVTNTRPNEIHPILDYIQKSEADIVCLQEVGPDFLQNSLNNRAVRRALKEYKYVITGALENRYSVVCLSKYPVIRYDRIKYKSKSNSSFYYDIKIGKDTIRVINNHLESNKLNSEEKNKYSDFLKNRESDQFTKVAEALGSKVGNASVIRANQADAISKVVQESPHQVIVCGDFNDVPGSYTYRTVRKGMLDSWVENGEGWGNTFHENFFLFRIDYILHTSGIQSFQTKVDKVRFSDHYPIWAKLKIK